MRPQRTPVLRWLSLRVRLTCLAIFAVSLFVPPYVSDSTYAAEDVTDQDVEYLFVEDGFLMKTSSLTEGARLAYGEGIYHTVEDGETISSIAKLYKIKQETIRWANSLNDGAGVKPGQRLLILPVDGVVHVVERGQNLIKIAELYKVSVDEIAKQNNIENGYLRSGQQLIIPGGKPPAPPTAIAQNPPKAGTTPAPGRVIPGVPEGQKPIPPRRGFYDGPVGKGTFMNPCGCYITQYFSGKHFALDMQAKNDGGKIGGPIYAAGDGEVIRADYGWNGGYGNVIEIDHGNGVITLYGHNKELLVKAGDKVKKGEQISVMGRTGLVYGKTGIHVHFEVRVNGVKKNPLPYIQ